MNKTAIFILLVFVFFGCQSQKKIAEPERANYVILIHGGAGNIDELNQEQKTAYTEALHKALNLGKTMLEKKKTAVEVVEAVIIELENNPLFNAGKGSVFTYEGKNEMDASIMDGSNLNAGAVAGVSNIKNPISAALAVMNNSPHVFLSGKGAEKFAEEQGLKIVPASYFFTQERYDAYSRQKESSKHGTVGCVVLDMHGNLAAGTSTGGMSMKRWNRIGDSPVIGAGTYANNNSCAVSCTGHGEFFIRNLVAYDLSALMEYKNMEIQKAADLIIQEKLKAQNAEGGLIAVDKYGNIAVSFNTSAMFRAYYISKKPLDESNISIF
jgi:L-asparaginase / beta-aspartyl-peptidase